MDEPHYDSSKWTGRGHKGEYNDSPEARRSHAIISILGGVFWFGLGLERLLSPQDHSIWLTGHWSSILGALLLVSGSVQFVAGIRNWNRANREIKNAR